MTRPETEEYEESLERLKQIVEECLYQAFKVHESLGPAGEELVQKNQFGETALRADIEMEQAVLDVLKERKVPIKVVSEEHGLVEIGNPQYLGILDGLDGSSVYKKERGTGRYGTMFGILNSLDPRYQDYLVCGVMEHSTSTLFLAAKGQGAWRIKGNDKATIHSSNCGNLGSTTRIYVNTAWEATRETFLKKLTEFKTSDPDSLAVFYADLASGAVDLVLDCTRKRNLEEVIAYGLENEAGAVMVDLAGKSLGPRKYFEFGQDKSLPTISAATEELAKNLIGFLSLPS